MAPSIANFHHIEIDNIGKRRRNLHPPGGESSDIFNFRKQTVVTQPRRVKFHTRSSIFSRESPPTNSRLPVLSLDPKFNTKQRLFGPPDEIPRKAVDRLKSSIFATDPEPGNKTKVSKAKPDKRNPITGEECAIIKHVKRHQIQKKKSNPITGEGYESPDDDGSTLRSSCSSRSDTSYKETISAQPSSPGSRCDGKETVSTKPSSPGSNIHIKERISERSNSPRSHIFGKERNSTRPSSPRSHTYGKEGIPTRPSSPRSPNYDKESIPAQPNSPGSHTAFNNEETSADSGKEVVLYNKL